MFFNFNGEYYLQGNTSLEYLWEKLTWHDGRNDIILAGTPYNSRGDRYLNEVGISYTHAYTVLGTKTLSTGQRLVKMRNPWGAETYSGKFSDGSSDWNAELLEEVEHKQDDDGVFYMPVEDYHTSIETTFVSYDTTCWTKASFLMLDDQTNNPGRLQTCGSSCTSHKLTLTTDKEVSVHLTAHTWDSRGVAEEC